MNKVVALKEPTAGGNEIISFSEPFTVTVEIEGAADYLFHRWNVESVDEKAKASKNSRGKKTDDIESYVWRTSTGDLALPGTHLRGAIVAAAKFRQDPRSPRKSACDLYKAGVCVLTQHATLGTSKWDYIDRARVTVQRQGINRSRPAMHAGWKVSFDIMVNLPEYIDANQLREVIEAAGRLCGLGDYRPTYGRFGIVSYNIIR